MLRRLLMSSWIPAAGGLLFTSLVTTRFGVSWDEVLRYLAYLALCVSLPGVFTWRLLLRRTHEEEDRVPTWFEDLALGTVFGFGVQLPVFLLAVAVGAPLLVWLLPLLVVALSIATPLGRGVWTLPTNRLHPGTAWGLAGISVFGNLWLWRQSAYLAPLQMPGNKAMSIDETFHQALVAEVGNRFPPQIPNLMGYQLEYHWFVHAQIAAANAVTGLDSPTMLRVIMPAVMLLLALLALGAVALRLTGRHVAAFIAPALMAAGAYHLFGPDVQTYKAIDTYLSARFLLSPSHSYGVMMSMPAIMLVLEVLRPSRHPSWPMWLALAWSLLALAGSKATYIPIFLCGAIAAWVVILLLRRKVDPSASILVGILVVVTGFSQLVLLGGRTGSLILDPFLTVEVIGKRLGIEQGEYTVVLMTATLLMSWLLYGAGVVGLGRGRLLDPRLVWMVVGTAAGITVPFLLYRGTMAQLWFSRSIATLVILASVWGLSRLMPNPLTRRHALVFSAVAATSGVAAFGFSLLLASERERPGTPDVTALVLTVVVPLVIVGTFLLARLVLGRARTGGSLGTALVVTVLVSLGSASVVALGYSMVTDPDRPNPGRRDIFAAGGIEAADQIRRGSSVDEVVATNVHCADPDAPKCDIRSFWVAAKTERRIVIEGWGYSAPANAMKAAAAKEGTAPTPPDDIQRRLAVNDAVFANPSERALGRLVDEYDVSWLFVSKKYPADVAGLKALDSLDVQFENKNYLVLEVVA